MRQRVQVTVRAGLALAASLWAGVAMAGADCLSPMADWQPREALAEKARGMGWQVERIRTDDGCYKVYAMTPEGRRIEAEFEPATLTLREIETEDD